MDELLDFLDEGYVLVSGKGLGARTADQLVAEGYKVVVVQPNLIRAANGNG